MSKRMALEKYTPSSIAISHYGLCQPRENHSKGSVGNATAGYPYYREK